jgi:hypothetical protein
MLQFFIGLDHPATAWPFLRSMISNNTIRDRKDRSFLGSSPKRLEPTFLNGNPGFRNAFLSCLGCLRVRKAGTLAPREETTARRSVKSYANPA